MRSLPPILPPEEHTGLPEGMPPGFVFLFTAQSPNLLAQHRRAARGNYTGWGLARDRTGKWWGFRRWETMCSVVYSHRGYRISAEDFDRMFAVVDGDHEPLPREPRFG